MELSTAISLVSTAFKGLELYQKQRESTDLAEAKGKLTELTKQIVSYEEQYKAKETELENFKQSIQAKILEEYEQARNYLTEKVAAKNIEIEELQKLSNAQVTDIQRLEEEKVALEETLKHFDLGIESFTGLLGDLAEHMNASHQAAKWLDANRNSLISLAVEELLKNAPELFIFDSEEKLLEIQNLCRSEINQYLNTIHCCLIIGGFEPIDELIIEGNISLSLPTGAYQTALNFIKTQEKPESLSTQAADDLTACFDYLIDKLS